MRFMYEYQAEYRPWHSVDGSQSTQCWVSLRSGPSMLWDMAVINYKWRVLDLKDMTVVHLPFYEAWQWLSLLQSQQIMQVHVCM